MSKSGLTAGDRITSRCTRCNDLTGHVIVAMVGAEVVKVQCLACGSTHKYRPERREVPRKDKPAVRRARTGSTREEAVAVSRADAARKAAATRAATRAAQEAQATEVAWKVALTRLNGDDSKPYRMDAVFEPGDIINHPTFGLGEVRLVIRPDKMEVLFQGGMRVLRCAC